MRDRFGCAEGGAVGVYCYLGEEGLCGVGEVERAASEFDAVDADDVIGVGGGGRDGGHERVGEDDARGAGWGVDGPYDAF